MLHGKSQGRGCQLGHAGKRSKAAVTPPYRQQPEDYAVVGAKVEEHAHLLDIHAQIGDRLRDAVDRDGHGYARIVAHRRPRISTTTSASSVSTTATNRRCNQRDGYKGNDSAPAATRAPTKRNHAKAHHANGSDLAESSPGS